MVTSRMRKVQSLLVREISEILAREIKDPRVLGVTIVEVKSTSDLRRAVIFYRVIDAEDAQRKEAAAGLKSAKGALKRILGSRINLKFTPDLEFKYDPSEDRVERIETLLRGVLPEDGGSRDCE